MDWLLNVLAKNSEDTEGYKLINNYKKKVLQDTTVQKNIQCSTDVFKTI